MMARKGMLSQISLNDKRLSAERKRIEPRQANKKSNIIIQEDDKIEQPQPQPFKKSPTPFQQTKISRTNQSLSQIPIPFRPQLIQQLYLSHNSIKSVQNKLRLFPNLRNLNLSYNCLDNVAQFISEVNGDSDECKLPLKMLYIRMNQFDYGYQDQIVFGIKTLEVFEEFLFTTKANSQIKGQKIYQNAGQIQHLSSRVSNYFLLAFTNLNQAIFQLSRQKSFIEDSSFHQIAIERIKSRCEKIISRLSAKIQPSKEKAYLPSPRMKALENISEYLVQCLDLAVGEERRKQYINTIGTSFTELVKQILIKFSNRNNKQLMKTLKKWSSCQKDQEIQDLQSLVDIFGRVYNARRYNIYEPTPGKYIEKINPLVIKQHPLVDFLELEKGEETTIREGTGSQKTLDGDRRRCKNTMIRNLGLLKQSIKNIDQNQIFQRIPIFVFQRNYLQVVTQILNEKVAKFIRIYDHITRVDRDEMTHKITSPSPFQNQGQYNKNLLNCNIYIKQNNSWNANDANYSGDQENIGIDKGREHMRSKEKRDMNKLETITEMVEDDKMLDNGYAARKTVKKQYAHQKKERGGLGLQKKREKKETGKTKKEKYHNNDVFLELRPSTESGQTSQNLDKFSLYQINLAYKVFHILKIRVQRKRKVK